MTTLREAGWDHKPFDKLNNAGMVAGPADGTLFDVVLMEYPFGVLPTAVKEAEKLGEKFLGPAKQVRPFAFVRGDWFVEASTTAPLVNDLRELIKPPYRIVYRVGEVVKILTIFRASRLFPSKFE